MAGFVIYNLIKTYLRKEHYPMDNSKRTSNLFLGLVSLAALIIVVGLFSVPIHGGQPAQRSWLMQFENGPVTVNFVAAPVAKSRLVDARLISVEENGLVLRLSQDKDKFYPYANIISIDPK
jgi:hypothetical protein